MNALARAFKIKSSFTLSSKVKSFAILFTFIFGNFIAFRALQANESKQIMSAISTILRNESMTANPYQLSKSISDIETLGLLECVILKNADGSIFYDTSGDSRCSMNDWIGSIRNTSAEISSISGISFFLKIQPKMDYSKLLLEVLFYFLIVAIFIQIRKNLVRKTQITEARIKAIEIEKQMMLDHTRQIRHDVASPLTAINTIVRLIPKMDPELKAVLLSATEKTQAIFNDLNKPASSFDKNQPSKFDGAIDAISVLEEVLAEKKSVWGNSVETIYINSITKPALVNGERGMLSRVISNLLNNSFEAMDFSRESKILVEAKSNSTHTSIEISDNGKGISAEHLARIGEKGFSLGKEGHATAGSGLGIYGAIQALKEWDGDLKISSIEDSGTSVLVTLKRSP